MADQTRPTDRLLTMMLRPPGSTADMRVSLIESSDVPTTWPKQCSLAGRRGPARPSLDYHLPLSTGAAADALVRGALLRGSILMPRPSDRRIR
jgi:hypothetical protein